MSAKAAKVLACVFGCIEIVLLSAVSILAILGMLSKHGEAALFALVINGVFVLVFSFIYVQINLLHQWTKIEPGCRMPDDKQKIFLSEFSKTFKDWTIRPAVFFEGDGFYRCFPEDGKRICHAVNRESKFHTRLWMACQPLPEVK